MAAEFLKMCNEWLTFIFNTMEVELNGSPDNQFRIYMGRIHWEIISDRDKD
jgi:hypothetical protein